MSESAPQEVVMDKEQFEDFMRCISILKDICNDVDIRDGIIRQRTNDKFSVFQLDLNPVLSDLSIPITNLKQKIDLFKIFTNEEVTIKTEDGKFTIGDQYSNLTFDYPDLDFLDNTFMDAEELVNIFQMNEEDIILSTNISEKISERIRIITGSFNVNTVRISFDGETASITTKTQSKDQHADLISNIVTDKVIEASSNTVATPFVIDHDGDLEFKMYNYEDNICANKYTTTISDVDIIIFGRSTLQEEEGE